jgi:hypothetical protein
MKNMAPRWVAVNAYCQDIWQQEPQVDEIDEI